MFGNDEDKFSTGSPSKELGFQPEPDLRGGVINPSLQALKRTPNRQVSKELPDKNQRR